MTIRAMTTVEERLAKIEGRVESLFITVNEKFEDLRKIVVNDLTHMNSDVRELQGWRQQMNGWTRTQAEKTGKLEGKAWLVIGVMASLVSALVSGILQITSVMLGLGR